jgi:hypothetical protein
VRVGSAAVSTAERSACDGRSSAAVAADRRRAV